MGRKKGNILVSNVMYIVLVLLFMGVLFLFVSQQSSSGALLEQRLAKKIALTIDAAEVNSQISINVEDAMGKVAEGENPVGISGNSVNVRLGSKKGYSYSFFNDVSISNLRIEKTEQGRFLYFVVK